MSMEIDRKQVAQARTLALEPRDPLMRERRDQLIEDLELRLQNYRKGA
jgi:hypothetical protein